MRKQNCPTIADPAMEIDGALRGFSGEVGSNVINARNAGCGRWKYSCCAHFSSYEIFCGLADLWDQRDYTFGMALREIYIQDQPASRRVGPRTFSYPCGAEVQ